MKTLTIWTGLAVLLMSTAAWAQANSNETTKPIRSQILLPIASIKFEPLVINNIEVKDGVPYPINEPELRAKMARQFEEWIVRSATRKHFALKILPISNEPVKAGQLQLRMVLNIPLTHRADSSHFDNLMRRGKFMEYSLLLSDSAGKLVSRVDDNLVWGDGEWSHISNRQRFSMDHDEVMKGYVRKSVDRAVEAMKRELAQRTKGS